MLKIRLTRTGRKKLPSYRIVVADSRSKRDGKPVKYIGHYSPINKDVVIDKELAKAYLDNGAQPTETVKGLLVKAGVIAAK